MKQRAAWLVCAVLASYVSVAAQPGEHIVFARVFPQPTQIGLFIANADGSDERRLVTPADTDYDATWSANGSSIVFTSERNGSADLYRVHADGSGLERLTDSPAYDDQASLSSDGRSAVFVTTRAGGTADLWILDLATKQAKPLTSGPGGDYRPSWSPDGRWIAFASDRLSNLPFSRGRWEHLQLADIYIIRPDGTGLKALTPHGDFCGSPKWYPDSQRIVAYCTGAQNTVDVRLNRPEHNESTRLVSLSLAGVVTDVSGQPGVKFNPSLVRGAELAWLRKDGPEAGVVYASGARGPRGDLRGAAWSPDGTRIVYHKRIPFTRKPWVQTFAKDSRYTLTLTGGGPAFSPTGERFAFVAPGGANAKGAGIGIGTPASEATTTVFKDDARNILGPQWSADGQRIIFGIGEFAAFFNGFHSEFLQPTDRVEGGAQIAIVNADGTSYRELTRGANNNGFPSFAPDGERVVYRTFGPEGDGLRIMNIATGKSTMLVPGYDNFPLWSPRGDVIIFSRQVEGDYEIYSVKPDGTGIRRLTNSRGNDAHMGWSPDGSHIVFASTRMGFKDEVVYTDAPQPYGEIFVMRADGTDLQQLTDNQWEEGTPAWRPPAGATRVSR